AALHAAAGGSMRFSRRTFIGSAGAGLLLAPFLSSLDPGRGKARGGATGRAKRLLLFCTMGTNPDIWTPTSVTGETSFTFSPATSPLAAIKDSIVLIEGCPSANPGDGHGAPDGLTGIGYGGQGQASMISVDQFISDKLVAAGVNRPIPTLLLGAGTLA